MLNHIVAQYQSCIAGFGTNYFVARNPRQVDGGATVAMQWHSIDAAGIQCARFSGLFARRSFGSVDLTRDDYVAVDYSFDNGTNWLPVLRIVTAYDAISKEYILQQDLDLDGSADNSTVGINATLLSSQVFGLPPVQTLSIRMTLSWQSENVTLSADSFALTSEQCPPNVVFPVPLTGAAIGTLNASVWQQSAIASGGSL
eukprot:TRINITY_DN3069_c0_g2_i1.p1 TRINITY_DN3069_c0_g2~~TRINITY_DN3069_c0_g2_i1.p1  ORF type:complete len:200 (-),score=28.80 TRINITY_DN3069_c0_g2_i1:257-856(-)